MTDTPTPERGEFSDLLDTLCSTWHQKEETDYDHMRGSCSTLDAARADFAYREARRLVVKHVDALRAECARLNEIAEGWRVKAETYAHERDEVIADRARILDIIDEEYEDAFPGDDVRTMQRVKDKTHAPKLTPHPGAPRDGE